MRAPAPWNLKRQAAADSSTHADLTQSMPLLDGHIAICHAHGGSHPFGKRH